MLQNIGRTLKSKIFWGTFFRSKFFWIGTAFIVLGIFMAVTGNEVFADQLSEGHNYIVEISDGIEVKDSVEYFK